MKAIFKILILVIIFIILMVTTDNWNLIEYYN